MQTDWLETFLDLCETRSFTRTADRLRVTQSTVSARIRALESTLGCRLLQRARAGTALTTEGLRFEPHARALRHGWAEAQHAVRGAGDAAMVLRIGVQRDLADHHIGDWMTRFRDALPGAGFYIEADYSEQMCNDLVAGAMDLAILYTPKPQPDLHFESLGEVAYRMVSTLTDRLAEVRAETYVRGNFAPAFSAAHAALLPRLDAAPISSGQNATVAGLVQALGGTAYVLEDTARAMQAAGQARAVRDAPTIRQPVFAAIQIRNRHRSVHHRLLSLLRTRFIAPPPPG
jgi:LysR family transcriptional regulator, flagellar master operon regulator